MHSTSVQSVGLLASCLTLITACAAQPPQAARGEGAQGARESAPAPAPQSARQGLEIVLGALEDAGLDEGRVVLLELDAQRELGRGTADESVRVCFDVMLNAESAVAAALAHEHLTNALLEDDAVQDCSARSSRERESGLHVEGIEVTLDLGAMQSSAGETQPPDDGGRLEVAARRAATDPRTDIGGLDIFFGQDVQLAPGWYQQRMTVRPFRRGTHDLKSLRRFLALLEETGGGARVTHVRLKPDRGGEPGADARWSWEIELARSLASSPDGPRSASAPGDRT